MNSHSRVQSVCAYSPGALLIRRCALAALVVGTWGVAVPAVAGESYRWIDDQGDVHYGDSVPPEYRNNPHTRLDAAGNPIQTVESTLEQALDGHTVDGDTRDQDDPDADPDARDDDQLLDMFANERDLLRTRDDRLEGLDNRINWLQRQLDRAERQLEALAADAATERHDELAGAVERRQSALDDARALRAATAFQFEADLKRMRELEGGGQAASE